MTTISIDKGAAFVGDLALPRKSPRILYVASTRHSGGLEVASVRQAAMLMREIPFGQQILFACKDDQYIHDCCTGLGIPTRSFSVANSGDLSSISQLMRIIAEDEIDIVHVHSRRDFVAARLAVSSLRRKSAVRPIKLVFQMHLVRKLGSPSMLSGYFFANTVDKFIAVSNTVKSHLMTSHKAISEDQIVVIPNGIEFDKYNREPIAGNEIRHAYGIPSDAIVAGMVGRLDTKGQDRAIAALGELKNSSVYLLLVGASGLNGYEQKLKRVAKSKGVSETVVFCGAQVDVSPYLSAMDFLVHLPTDEAFGLAPAEAMAAGLPVIVSNCKACLELVDDGIDGLVVNAKNGQQVTNAFAAMIGSPERRGVIGAAASRSVRSRFSISGQAAALTSLYSNLIDEW